MPKSNGAESAGEDINNLPFEEAMKKLESIVNAMEAQDLPLEALLAQYEEGARLVQSCQARLHEAELKIQELEKNVRGEITLKPATLENHSPVPEKERAD